MKPARTVSLTQLKAKQTGVVREVTGGAQLRQKLMSMGVYEGKEVTKVSHIGLRGPVVIKAGRSILALGHGVAAKVMVETA